MISIIIMGEISMSNKTKNTNLITVYDPDSQASEAFRSLRTNIIFRNFEKEVKVINIVSTTNQEGKSTIALNLAVVFAQLDKNVLVIDLDLRIRTIHKKLNIKNSLGISDILNKSCQKSDAVIKFAKYLDVITAGTRIIYQSELLQSIALKNFILKMREEYDYIILDCPPISLVTDGVIVSSYCDATLLVVEANRNSKKELLDVKSKFENINCNIIGTILNKAPATKSTYSYRYSDQIKNKNASKRSKFNPFKGER